MASNRVRLIILDTEFTLSSDEPISYMADVGREIDHTIRTLMNSSDRMTFNRAAVLTAINNLDRARKAEESADHLRSQVKEYLDENNTLRAELEQLRRQLGR